MAMKQTLRLDILPQPDDTTCGPTCLHAVYRYWGDEIPLAQVIGACPRGGPSG
jgi:ABC-type bacteriocin/lantibiotic exporter with double-glycine peptidase domain